MTEIIANNGQFHLRNASISYIMAVTEEGVLAHLYFGRRLEALNAPFLGFADSMKKGFDLDKLPQECPTFGHGDLREGAVGVRSADGMRVLDLRYASFEIADGKPALNGLPASFDREGTAKTLFITLTDALLRLDVVLLYTIFDDCDVLARSIRIENHGDSPVRLTRALSANVDFDHSDFDLLTLSGAWARERFPYRRALVPGQQGVSSARGASSAQQNPFMALLKKGATEDAGEVYGFALVYSGNFSAHVEVDWNLCARAQIGINDYDFEWLLEPDEAFTAPEAVLCYSSHGLSGMSEAFHTLCRRHVVRGQYAFSERPVLLNNWEATYFNFDEEKLLTIAKKAKELGIELFVLDDGWFGKRDDDHSSLGDWVENRRKLPDGLEGLCEKVHAMGLQFGLWFEPEMVSPDSDLYRAHPDWCLHVDGRERTERRNQLTLDMSRADVCAYVEKAVTDVLKRVPLDYIKWDMNRNFSPIGSAELPPERQMELAHRYMLGLYGVLERVTSAYPNVLFESCASGGGRFDLGMMYYMPQAWCSDDTDAGMRCKIQYGTSFVFPQSVMGAHVSAVPNHQTGRLSPLDTRALVAMGGAFGYEMDVSRMTPEEQAQTKADICYMKGLRSTLLYGQMHRLLSPFEGEEAAWMVVSEDRREAVVTAVSLSARVRLPTPRLPLKGLDEGLTYRVEELGREMRGDELMYYGLPLPYAKGDRTSVRYTLRAV